MPAPTPPRPARGHTLVELCIGLVVLAVLATVALPSYQEQLRRIRRSDALRALATVQQWQERWRAGHEHYCATLGTGGLGLPEHSPDGHYRITLALDAATPGSAYTVRASALDGQQGDSGCQELALELGEGTLVQRSGPDATLGNGATANQRCWGR